MGKQLSNTKFSGETKVKTDKTILVADEKTRVDATTLETLKPTTIINSCKGRDHIDYDECTKRGVQVIEINYEHEASVADHAVTMLLQLTVLNPKQRGEEGNELKGKRALIVGAGRIGKAIHERLFGFGVETRYYDPYADFYPDQWDDPYADFYPDQWDMEFEHEPEMDNLKEALDWCDYCFLACPLTQETRGLIGKQNKIPATLRALINVARAEIVDANALMKAIKNGLLVGWDFHNETRESEPTLFNYLVEASAWGNAIITKHNAWRTREAKERRMRAIDEAKEANERLKKIEAKLGIEEAKR